MNTEKIREALLSRGLTHDVSEAFAEVEAIERARRLALEQIDSMRADYKSRAVLDPGDVISDLGRLRRILGDAPGGRS